MPRDKHADPRREARRHLNEAEEASRRDLPGEIDQAHVWALIHQGDAIHRLAKAVEHLGPGEPERFKKDNG